MDANLKIMFQDLETLEYFLDIQYITLEQYYEIKERIIECRGDKNEN